MSKANNKLSQRIAQLDDIVAWFDGEEFNLEEAMQKYREAEKVASEIDAELTEFKNEITVLKQKFDQE